MGLHLAVVATGMGAVDLLDREAAGRVACIWDPIDRQAIVMAQVDQVVSGQSMVGVRPVADTVLGRVVPDYFASPLSVAFVGIANIFVDLLQNQDVVAVVDSVPVVDSIPGLFEAVADTILGAQLVVADLEAETLWL